jgi:hypothetical protein
LTATILIAPSSIRSQIEWNGQRWSLGGDDEPTTRSTLSAVARDPKQQLADLVMTVGFYQLVCNFLNTFEVSTEGEAGHQSADT